MFGYTALARISGLRGDHRAAMRYYDLIAALGARWGTPYERHRSLVEGGRIAYLLQSGRLNEAITGLIASGSGKADGKTSAHDGAVPGPIEPLSDREKKILNPIAAGSTNNTISVSLFISLNTVKWHLKNIFAKLGVRNRTSAVAVVRQLELIP